MGKSETQKVGKKKAVKLSRLAGKKGGSKAVEKGKGGKGSSVSDAGKGSKGGKGGKGGKGSKADGKGKGKGKGKGNSNKSRPHQDSKSNKEDSMADGDPEGEGNYVDDYEVGSEDENFFAEHAKYSGFLSNLEIEAPVSGKINSRKERVELLKAVAKSKKQTQPDRAKFEKKRSAEPTSSGEEESSDDEEEEEDSDDDEDGGQRSMAMVERNGRRAAAQWNNDDDDDDEVDQASRRRGLPVKLPDGSVDYMYAQPAKPLASGPREAAAMKKQAKIEAAAAKAAAAAEAAGNEEEEDDEAATSGLSQRAKAKLMKAKAAGEEKKDKSKQRAEDEMDAEDDEEGWGSSVDDDDDDKEEADEARSRAESMQAQQAGAHAAAAAADEASDPMELQEALRARVEAHKVSIATLCEAVLEAPEEHLAPSRAHPKGWSTLTQLFDVAKNDPDATVRTLATLSQMAVLRDLVPAYRIRLPTAQEKATKVSKEIRALRDYEALLLGHYQAFLKHCDASCQTGSGRYAAPHERAYGGIAATCLGELLCAHPHFNFRAHVLKILAAKAGCAAKEMRGPCCTSLENLFDADQQGDVTLEAVKLIAKAVKDGRYAHAVDPVRTFTRLKLEVKQDTMSEQALKKAAAKNKKQRQRWNEKRELEDAANRTEEEVEAQLREADALIDEKLKVHCMKETLKEVVVTYFRCVKGATDASVGMPSKSGHRGGGAYVSIASGLLPAALEGLARVAHLVNVDTVEDLLVELRLLLQASQQSASSSSSSSSSGGNSGGSSAPTPAPLPLEAAFNCVKCAMRTLRGGGKEGNAKYARELAGGGDESAFADALFSLLPRLSCDWAPKASNARLAVECCELVLLKRKEYSVVRVAAFVHRLFLVASTATSPVTSAALVATARAVLFKYPQAHQLLEGDEDRATAKGAFKPYGQALTQYSASQHKGNAGGNHNRSSSVGAVGTLVVEDTPELTNPLAAAAWELAVLKCHWHPTVSQQAKAAVALSLPTPPDNPVLLHKDLSAATLFHPSWKTPPPSALHALVKKQNQQKHARQRRPVFLRLDSMAAPVLHLGTEGKCDGMHERDIREELGFSSAAPGEQNEEDDHAAKGRNGEDSYERALRALFREKERPQLEARLRRAEGHMQEVNHMRGAWKQQTQNKTKTAMAAVPDESSKKVPAAKRRDAGDNAVVGVTKEKKQKTKKQWE